ncbi:CCC motif membrane protein [Winogradskyella eximia]|uniref:CCC motif membrane protein n=1 Tax=Winogradskyella eximia TaxID=262006 RepID=UPI0024907E14|nr:CCC motif membrane protein [Winogradskyella eximia]
MNQNKLPADPLALILGVLALVIGLVGCCCYGVTAIVPLTMAIIGLVVANKSIREFDENPEAFDSQSRNNVNTAKIINIIAIVLNGFIFLAALAAFVFYGTLISSAILDGIKNGDFENDDYYYDTEIEKEVDSISTWTDEDYIIESIESEDDIEEMELESAQ